MMCSPQGSRYFKLGLTRPSQWIFRSSLAHGPMPLAQVDIYKLRIATGEASENWIGARKMVISWYRPYLSRSNSTDSNATYVATPHVANRPVRGCWRESLLSQPLERLLTNMSINNYPPPQKYLDVGMVRVDQVH
jgi:hypothetical protein